MEKLKKILASKALWTIVGAGAVGAASYFGGPVAGQLAAQLLKAVAGEVMGGLSDAGADLPQ